MTGPPDKVAVVADDDGVTRRILLVLLERQQFRVCLAEDGEGALRLVRDEAPDIVFLDAQMPAPDGFEVCRTLRKELSAARQPYVIMITAAGRDVDREKAAAVGVDRFLTKPFSPSQLSQQLDEVSGKRRRPLNNELSE